MEHDGLTHPAGTWVVPMNQEFGELARQVLEVQTYPDLRAFPEGPPDQPYDAAGWTLPYQMGVRSIEARSPLSEAMRQAMELVGGTTAGGSEGELARDAAPFDSVPGVGFDTHPVAAGIVPPTGELRGRARRSRCLPLRTTPIAPSTRPGEMVDVSRSMTAGVSSSPEPRVI